MAKKTFRGRRGFIVNALVVGITAPFSPCAISKHKHLEWPSIREWRDEDRNAYSAAELDWVVDTSPTLRLKMSDGWSRHVARKYARSALLLRDKWSDPALPSDYPKMAAVKGLDFWVRWSTDSFENLILRGPV